MQMRKLALIAASLIVLSSCAHSVSKEARAEAKGGPDPAALFADPEAHRGETVVIGGTIVSVKNTGETAMLEVLQKPLDYRGKPRDTDESLGRFIVLHKGFLDSALYRKGRDITVAAEVSGQSVRPLEGVDYKYLLLISREIHLIRRGQGGPSISFGFGAGFVF